VTTSARPVDRRFGLLLAEITRLHRVEEAARAVLDAHLNRAVASRRTWEELRDALSAVPAGRG
jgi:hypothetical protein